MFRFVFRCFCFVVFFSAEVKAQCKFGLFGMVRDARNRSVLPGASIRILGTENGTVTDGDGHYHLHNLCAGEYVAEVFFLGYEKQSIRIKLKANRETDFFLKPDQLQLQSVQVKGIRSDKPLQNSSTLQSRQLELSRGQSLGEALKTIPGLNSIQTGPTISKPVIHGMHSNRIVIYNAGVRQEGQQWGSEHAPEIDPFIANEITVVKGAASVQYGSDAMAGVILVEPKALDFTGKLRGTADVVAGSNSGSGTLSGMAESSFGRQNQFAMRVQATGNMAGTSRSPGYFLNNTGARQLNGAVLFGYQNGRFGADVYASSFNARLGIFSGAHIGNLTDLQAAFSRNRPLSVYTGGFSYGIGRPYQNIHHNLVKLRSYYNTGFGRLNVQYAWQSNFRQEFDLHNRSNTNRPQLEFDLTTQSLDVSLAHSTGKNFNGTVGINGQYQQNYYDGRYLIPFFRSRNAGAFVIERYTLNRLTLEAGARYDYKWLRARMPENPTTSNSSERNPPPERTFSQASGTLGVRYAFSPTLTLQATVAKAWRAPTVNELYSFGVHHGSATFERGNESLKAESGWNFSGGIQKEGRHFAFDLSGYYNLIDRYIYLKPSTEPVLTIRGAFPAFDYVQVNARFYGADASATISLTKNLDLISKYSMVRATNRATGDFLELIPADRIGNTLSYRFGNGRLVKQPTLDIGHMFVARQSRVNPTTDFAPPPAAYHLFNVDASAQIMAGKRPVKLSLSVQNALNTRYRDYLNRFRYFTDDVGANFLLRVQIPFGQTITQ